MSMSSKNVIQTPLKSSTSTEKPEDYYLKNILEQMFSKEFLGGLKKQLEVTSKPKTIEKCYEEALKKNILYLKEIKILKAEVRSLKLQNEQLQLLVKGKQQDNKSRGRQTNANSIKPSYVAQSNLYEDQKAFVKLEQQNKILSSTKIFTKFNNNLPQKLSPCLEQKQKKEDQQVVPQCNELIPNNEHQSLLQSRTSAFNIPDEMTLSKIKNKNKTTQYNQIDCLIEQELYCADDFEDKSAQKQESNIPVLNLNKSIISINI